MYSFTIGQNMCDDVFIRITQQLNRIPALIDIDISCIILLLWIDNEIEDEGMKTLFSQFSVLTNLESLILSHNNYTENCIFSFIENVHYLHNLQMLILSRI